jgi:hypothetical protein
MQAACAAAPYLGDVYPIQARGVKRRMELVERITMHARKEFLSAYLVLELASKLVSPRHGLSLVDQGTIYLWMVQAAVCRGDTAVVPNVLEAFADEVRSHVDEARLTVRGSYIAGSATLSSAQNHVRQKSEGGSREISVGELFAAALQDACHYLATNEPSVLRQPLMTELLGLGARMALSHQLPGLLAHLQHNDEIAVGLLNGMESQPDYQHGDGEAGEGVELNQAVLGYHLHFLSLGWGEGASLPPLHSAEHAYALEMVLKLHQVDPFLRRASTWSKLAHACASLDTSLALTYLVVCAWCAF